MYTRPTRVFSFCSASLVPQGKASRRVIASPIARSDNAAMGCERRAPRLKTRVGRVYKPDIARQDYPASGYPVHRLLCNMSKQTRPP